MCGIVGVVGARTPIETQEIEAMRDRLAHRGPDDSGIAFSDDRTTAFGHQRLAILDPSPAGHQPMTGAGGTQLITYNGEVYNFRALRSELEAEGVAFRSGSDAEVVLEACAAWGPGAVERLRGMFAFAIWDARTSTCLLARDRLGVKPLFWAVDGGTLYFASEATALLAAAPFGRQVDADAVCDFLTYGHVPAPKSIWQRLHKLEPGHRLLFQHGNVRIERYWHVLDHVSPDGAAASTSAEELAAAVRDAVESRMVSDVPIGAFLSGGIDSSTVTAFMALSSHQPVRTYSIDFTGSERSEAEFARLVARRYGTDHHERQIDQPPSLELFSQVIDAYDEPIADESTIPTYAIAAAVARDLKVILSGDGGDELFGGYGWYAKAARFDALAARLGGLGTLLALLGRSLPVGMAPAAARRLALAGGVTLDGYAELHGFITPRERATVLGDVLQPLAGDDPLWSWRRFWEPSLPLVRRLQVVDIGTFLPDDILAKVDRASMRHSLEVRVPLLDHHLTELALKLPTEAVLAHGESKRAFRRLAADLLPEPVLTRPKQGFGVPRRSWDAAGWGATMRTRLIGGQLVQRGWIQPRAIERWLAQPHGRIPGKLWQLMTLDVWLSRHGVA